MPVIASKVAQQVTTTQPVVIEAVNANSAQITISGVACYVALAYRAGPGMFGDYGPEERWMPTTTILSGEPVCGIRVRSAVPGQSAVVDLSLSA